MYVTKLLIVPLVGLVLATGCKCNMPAAKTHAPVASNSLPVAHGADRVYVYTYYPDSGVFYLPEASLYYWMTGDDWHAGDVLPSRFSLNSRNSEVVRLQSDTPYTYFDEKGDATP